jgi:hypothetical protein
MLPRKHRKSDNGKVHEYWTLREAVRPALDTQGLASNP